MLWNEIENKAKRLGTQENMVYREEAQKAILTALALKDCFNTMVFQGGTALRIFHGNPRFSEDIDLVLHLPTDQGEVGHLGGPGNDLCDFLSGVEQTLYNDFPFIEQAEVKTQKKESELQRYILVARSNNPEHSLRIHMELAAIPSYRNQPRILDYPPVYPAVRVENMDEILADKLCALALRPYLKGRDLWDIYFLKQERSVKLDWSLVHQKVEDYNKLGPGQLKSLEEGLETAREAIRNEGDSTLRSEMKRFLPRQLLESYESSFKSILDTVLEIISSTRPEMEGEEP
jgi:predicted nucleotidyltransferase component of viral defense system